MFKIRKIRKMKKWPRKGKLRDKKNKEEGMKPTGKVEQLKFKY